MFQWAASSLSFPQTTQPTALLLGRAQLLLPQPTCGIHFPPEQNRAAESTQHFFCYIFMKSARPSCCYTSLPSLYYLYQCTSVIHWTLVSSSLLWNNLLEPFYFSEFLYIIQKQQSLASPKVSQSAFQAPSNLSWIVLSLFYRCK